MNTGDRAGLSVPDGARLGDVQRLCDLQAPYSAGPDTDALFVSAMREALGWHQANSPFFRRLLADAGFEPGSLKSLADCARIPLVPANFFKLHEVVSIPRDQIHLHLTSSGTTGQKSQMFFDDWSIRSAQRMVDWIFRHYGWITPDEPANYLLYSYQTDAESRLGTAYTDNYLCKYAPVNEVYTALRLNGDGGHEFDVFGTIECLRRYAKDGRPVRIFGFPAFLYFTLERMRKLGCEPVRLSPASLVFLGGGWKGHADKAIAKADLYRLANEMLGIPDDRLRDGFGSVEHCVPYIECARHRFHVPVWSRVIVRDLRTLAPLPDGKSGFLSFISPYITSVPANAVLMGDLATRHPPESCDCGAATAWFEVHGRAGTSRNKSCAVAAAELLRMGGT